MSKKKRVIREIEIPGDVLEEILARLPAKSLLRFACVSKAWCSLFRNSSFISKHLLNGSEHALLNLKKAWFQKPELNNTFSLLEPPPDLKDLVNLDNIKDLYIVGQCHGLVCYLSGFKKPTVDLVRRNLVLHLWNPAIRQGQILPESNILPLRPPSYHIRDRFGFGHDPKSGDYKVVRFAFYHALADRLPEFHRMEAEVYSLRTDSWRPVADSPVVLKGRPLIKSIGVCLGGFCYWMGNTYTGLRVPMIISYDLSNEVFREYPVHPYPYPAHVRMASKIFVWKGSLALFMFPSIVSPKAPGFIDIWLLNAGVGGPLTLKEHLDADMVGGHLEGYGLLNDDLILTYDSHHKVHFTSKLEIKAFNISTRQMRNISSVKFGSYGFTLQIVDYTPSLVSLLT